MATEAPDRARFYLANHHLVLLLHSVVLLPIPPPESNLGTRGNGFKFYLSVGVGFTRGVARASGD